MEKGYFRLKVDELLEARETNLHKASHRGGFSYPTLHRYMRYPHTVNSISVRVLYSFLIGGLRIPPEELYEMKFGDIFEAIPDPEESES